MVRFALIKSNVFFFVFYPHLGFVTCSNVIIKLKYFVHELDIICTFEFVHNSACIHWM